MINWLLNNVLFHLVYSHIDELFRLHLLSAIGLSTEWKYWRLWSPWEVHRTPNFRNTPPWVVTLVYLAWFKPLFRKAVFGLLWVPTLIFKMGLRRRLVLIQKDPLLKRRNLKVLLVHLPKILRLLSYVLLQYLAHIHIHLSRVATLVEAHLRCVNDIDRKIIFERVCESKPWIRVLQPFLKHFIFQYLVWLAVIEVPIIIF